MKGIKLSFDVKNERELFFLMNLSFIKNYHIDSGKWGDNQEGLRRAITACFSEKNDDASCEYINFDEVINENFLGEYSFSFLNEYNACLFSWSYIKHLSGHGHKKNTYIMDLWEKTCMKLYTIPDTHEQRFRSVVGYFDCLGVEDKLALDRKRKRLSSMIIKWNGIDVKNKYTRWIDKDNQELCEWLWNYLLQEELVCNDIIIKDASEAYFAIMGFFSAWPDTPPGPSEINARTVGGSFKSKEDVLTRIHKTWMQKNYRKKLDSHEFKISKSTINKLYFIERKTNKKPGDLIEDYINDIYEKLKYSLKK